MKKILFTTLALILLGALIGVFAFINADKLIDRYIEGQSEGITFRTDVMEGDAMRLITIGTSAPLPSDRNQSCNVVIANGQLLVFDIGRGTAQAIERIRLPQPLIEAVFITHWHSDHFVDLPQLINRSWQLGRKHPLPVFGPEPIDTILRGINAMLSKEQQFRQEVHGVSIMDVSEASVITQEIHISGDQSKVVYDKGGVRVTAFEVDHHPVSPALGYRIDYQGKSIVISGDTRRSENLATHAKGADILVHEAMQMDFIRRAAQLQKESGEERNAIMLEGMAEYHSSPMDAAEVAQRAGVKKLILSHLAPVPENPISRRFFTKGMDEVYSGPILLAEDGDIFIIKLNKAK